MRAVMSRRPRWRRQAQVTGDCAAKTRRGEDGIRLVTFFGAQSGQKGTA